MGSNVFQSCTSLTAANWPKGWTTVLNQYNNTSYSAGDSRYQSPFYGSAIRTMEIPEGVTSIPKHAMRNVTTLTEITMSGSVSSIGAFAFEGAAGLNTVHFASGLKNIGNYAFNGCTALRDATLPEELKSIGQYAFQGMKAMEQMVLPATVTSVGNGAWENSVGLRNIYWNGAMTTIPAYAFKGCTGLVSVVLPDGIQTISAQAFYGCSNLAAVEIPDSVTSIADDAFVNCAKLKIYCYSASEAHYAAERNGWTYVLLDDHEHIYEVSEITATCTHGGSQTNVCTTCGYTFIELLDALGHDFAPEYTVTLEPTCEAPGRQAHLCTRCAEPDFAPEMQEEIPALGHLFGEWIIEKAPTAAENGLHYRICERCQTREEEELPKTGYVPDENASLTEFTVVDATTLEPIAGAIILIEIDEATEVPLVTNAEGRVSQLLPVGRLKACVAAGGCMPRNITFNVTEDGCVIPPIGLSSNELVDAKLTVTEMTLEEIIAAGIDINDPSNQHVYKYVIVLEFAPHIEPMKFIYYCNELDEILPYNPLSWVTPTPSPDTTDLPGVWRPYFPGGIQPTPTPRPEETPQPPEPPKFTYYDPDGMHITVYPVSERFYLIIYGEVHWLKEMFDVELLVFNNSLTDTLEDTKAELTLPEGLSLAAMVGEEQTLIQDIGTVGSGQSQSVHWYVRGDEEGTYSVSALLEGTMMPFGEEISQLYEAANAIKVYAGSAMRLDYYVPDTAYYGKPYTFRAELENISDKTLYNVSSLITGLKQCKVTHYSDGSTKETVYVEDGTVHSAFAREFEPGDKLVLEVTTIIRFETFSMAGYTNAIRGIVEQTSHLQDSMDMLADAAQSYDSLEEFFYGVKTVQESTADGGVELPADGRLAQLHDYMTFTKEAQGQTQSAIAAIKRIQDIINRIPVEFRLVDAYVEVLDESTTYIPTEIHRIPGTDGTGAVNPGKYLHALITALYTKDPNNPALSGWDSFSTAYEKIHDISSSTRNENVKAIAGQAEDVVVIAKDPQTPCRVWSEKGTLYIEHAGGDAQGTDVTLESSCLIEVTPQGGDDVLYIDNGEGVSTFTFDVSPAHECSAEEWTIMAYPTEDTDGYEAKICSVCEKTIDARRTTACSEHDFEPYVTEIEPDNTHAGVQTRICRNCHMLDYRVISSDYAEQTILRFDGNGAAGEMADMIVPAGTQITLPESGFTHETLKFAGWNTKADGTGDGYAAGAQHMFAANTTLYAQWNETGLMRYDMSGAVWSDTIFMYDGTEKTVTLSGLPEGVSVLSYTGNTATEAGQYAASATLAYDEVHYEAPVLAEHVWHIAGAIQLPESLDREYDGTNLHRMQVLVAVPAEPVFTYYRLAEKDGVTYEAKIDGAPANIGTYKVVAEVTYGEPAVTASDERVFTISKRAVELAPTETEFIYDGTEKTCVLWGAERLVQGHSVSSIYVDGYAALPGVYEKMLTAHSTVITDANGTDVTANYEITYAESDLTIQKRP